MWWNFSPLYMHMENKQDELLKSVYDRIGSNIILLNDILPRWTAASSFDKRTRRLLHQRNGWLAGTLYPGNDDMRPFREISKP